MIFAYHLAIEIRFTREGSYGWCHYMAQIQLVGTSDLERVLQGTKIAIFRQSNQVPRVHFRYIENLVKNIVFYVPNQIDTHRYQIYLLPVAHHVIRGVVDIWVGSALNNLELDPWALSQSARTSLGLVQSKAQTRKQGQI
ncbi:hypothetical protein SLA2020_306210 [Shorea laevis]